MKKHLISWILLLICNLMWSLQFTCIKLTQDQAGPYFTVWAPMLVSVILLAPFVLRDFRREGKKLKDVLVFGQLALLGAFPAQVLMTWGTQYSLASNSAILTLALPVISAVFAFLILKERMNPVRWLSFIVAIAGVILISSGDIRNLDFGSKYAIGNLLIFLAIVGNSYYNVGCKKVSSAYNAMEMVFYTYVVIVLLLTPLVLYYEGDVFGRIPSFTATTWTGMSILTIFHNFLSMVLFFTALKVLDAMQVALSNYLITLMGLPIAAIFLGERLGTYAIIGGMLVLGATLLISFADYRMSLKAPSNQQPATSNQHPAPSTQHPVTATYKPTPMKTKIKWGVIGSGGIAKRRTIPEGIIPAENAELTAVYDIDPEANRSVAGRYDAKAAGSIAELLGSDVDAVYVASPVNMHFEQVLACAKASRHVLCEKPLGMTVAEAKKMIHSCNEANVLLGVGLMMRFNTQHAEAKRMIEKGLLGKPVYARAQLSCWYPPIEGAWRQDPAKGGGGSLMDMGSHCLDLLEMFFGKAKQVSCFTANNVHDYKSEDSAVVSVMFENGAMGTVDTYFCIPDDSSKNILELYGSNGSIIAKGTIGQGAAGEMTAYLQNDTTGYNAEQSRSNGVGMKISPEPVNTYRAEIEEFGNAILENREPMNSFVHGLRSLELMEACYKSASTGKVIHL